MLNSPQRNNRQRLQQAIRQEQISDGMMQGRSVRLIVKAVPVLIVATFQATIVLGVDIWADEISFAGSLALFYLTMLIYGLSLGDFGLLISALCATRQQAFIACLSL